MTTASIDSDALNALFDNQNKLDDIFSSIFDEDTFYSNNSSSSNDYQSGSSTLIESEDYNPYSDYTFNAEDNFFVEKKSSITRIVMPVLLEIAIIYYGIIYFS